MVGVKCLIFLNIGRIVKINDGDLCPACKNGNVEALNPRREVWDIVGGYEVRIL
jgi:hypothetical protein